MRDVTQRRTGPRRSERGGSLEFPAGSTLFDSEHPCRYVYRLCSGQIRLASNRGAIIDYLSSGDFFGERSLLGSDRAGITAKSLSPVEVSVFSKARLLKEVQRDRQFGALLLKSLARRLEWYQQTIQDGIVERAERRLTLLLWRFLPTRPASGWVRLRFSPSNSELARTIGSTRWRIAHFMGHFQRLGWLQRRPELWVLREGLKAFLESTARRT